MSDSGWVRKTTSLIAETYDRYRPDYPKEVFDAISDYSSLDPTARCLEIGIGTGQATEPFLATGSKIVALEPAENLRDYARTKYAAYPSLEVRSERFEELPEHDRFDLIYAATAFHWVTGADRMADLKSHLTKGGCVALFWNHPAPDESIHDQISAVYLRVLPHDPQQSKKRWHESEAERIAHELRSGGFADVRSHLFRRDRVLTAQEYIGLLHTYSDHLSQPDEFRIPLMAGIEAVIEANGGHITIHDTIDLHLGRNAG